MLPETKDHFQKQLDEIAKAGLQKRERPISSPQDAHISVAEGRSVLNLCANNYLGLANDPRLIAAGKRALDEWGFGLASVRFICGTQTIHQELETSICRFLQTEDTILYSSCFDANGGLFETLLTEEDAVISDELNHASIIDGIRLCKAKRFRYRNNDMGDLREKLREASGFKHKLIATDGVFSMDGVIAKLPEICELADEFDAMVMVDDSHAVGFLGDHGRGTPEFLGVEGRIDILTGTLGKALGGASGGYTSGRKEIVELLRQRSRPYLFSNSVAPVVVGASLEAIKIISNAGDLRQKLRQNTEYFRTAMTEQGFDIVPGQHPIVPIMFGHAGAASAVAEAMLQRGVYVVAFSYPVVPMGKARIRCQISAAHP
jgi:glycine C-acetyltransferase